MKNKCICVTVFMPLNGVTDVQKRRGNVFCFKVVTGVILFIGHGRFARRLDKDTEVSIWTGG